MVVAEVWPDRGSDLLLFDVESRTVESLVATEHDETAPAVSPDGRWLAYVSDETGGREVWVRPLSLAGAPATRVSMDGGEEPVWSKGTRELFYRDPSRGDLVAAVYGVAPVFSVTERRPLFDATVYRHEAAARAYDVDAAGERFLMMRPTADAARTTTMHRMDGVVHEIRRSGSDGVPLERRLVLLALPVLLFASVMYIASRVSLGLTPVGALRQTARGFAYLGTMMLALAPIMLFANREVAGIGISAVLTGIASGALWWRGRRRIASAGDVLLSIPDVATRNFAAPSALFAMLGAVGWSFRPGMGWGGRILVLVVALVAGFLALRARSATVELRERGIVRLGQVSDWGKFEGFSWSPDAAATLVLVVRGRLPILSRYLLRVPPASRDDVVKVLDRLGQSVAADTPRRVERAHA
jgi:hypothetical protein